MSDTKIYKLPEDYPQQVKDLQNKVHAWKTYANDLNNWWLKYRDVIGNGSPKAFEAGMMQPNKPGYFRANND